MKDYHVKMTDEFNFNRASDGSEDGTFQYPIEVSLN